MEYRMLGKSDLQISRIGFGTMSLDVENPDSETLLLSALDGGINFFDTADIYQHGLCETLLGRTFHDKRDQVILASKVGNQWREDGSGLDWRPTKKYILDAAEQSLRRLQTDYIDLYQLHGGTLADPIDGIIEAFELLKAAGKIRYYGISSIRPNVIREYVDRSAIVSVMMQYSLLDRRPEEEMLSLLLEKQVGVLARGTLAKGLLVSKPAADYLDYTKEEVGKLTDAIHSVSANPRRAYDAAVQYVFRNTAVSAAVVGIRTNEQLEEALAVCDSTAFRADQMEFLRSRLPVNKYKDHR